MEFDQFFRAACGTDYEVYPYQTQLARSEHIPSEIRIPTGAGKTAAVVLSWLWRRRFADDTVQSSTPRRLVYCLPMRVLVEQTEKTVRGWVSNLRTAYPSSMEDAPEIHVLMGGREAEDWQSHPEAEQIIIGTQDMLLSRAMNRGYGSSPFKWPMEFGLLNNDAYWVLDEVQLMGPGLSTSAQLAQFRKKFGTYGVTMTTWMSATLNSEWLRTVDHEPQPEQWTLGEEDRKHPELARRLGAEKTLVRGEPVLGKTKAEEREYCRDVAGHVMKRHRHETLTIVVLNTVDRARMVYEALEKSVNNSERMPELRLIHSRFRPHERAEWFESFLKRDADIPQAGRIIVSTQVIEAGIDISARTLFTELAPWPSVVQRAGRCNRYGESDDACVIWLDMDDSKSPPYDASELDTARNHLRNLEGSRASPAALDDTEVEMECQPNHLLRSRDLIELFDTSSDLSGGTIDVSRFIRETDDSDVLVSWRDLGDAPPSEKYRPSREELCPVPIGEFREFLGNKKRKIRAWCWDHLDGQWVDARGTDVVPGRVVTVDSRSGWYSPETGWTPGLGGPVDDVHRDAPGGQDSTGDDRSSSPGYWQPSAEHSVSAERHARALLGCLADLHIPEGHGRAAVLASRLHDIGKAHEVFQNTLLRNLGEEELRDLKNKIWAKSARDFNRHERRHFRHELAGAVALFRRDGLDFGDLGKADDLTCYLIASHHGKVRLSIRSLPDEDMPQDGARYARGVWEGDTLPDIDIGLGLTIPATALELDMMGVGAVNDRRPSWLSSTLKLRDDPEMGPFRLAYLEALVRATDWRASRVDGAEEVKSDAGP